MPIRANRQKIGEDLRDVHGGITNETRFAPDDPVRTKKRFTLPALQMGGLCTFEQGWNRKARLRDVVRMTIDDGNNKIIMIFTRKDLEQMIFAMSSGDETIKYMRNEARVQRKY